MNWNHGSWLFRPIASGACLAVLCAALAWFSAPVFALSTVDQSGVIARPTVTVATISRPAFASDGEPQEELVGLDVDYVRPLADMCGVSFEFVIIPSWNRVIQMAKDGKVDAIIPTTKLPGRELFLIYPATPYQQAPVILFTHKDNPVERFTGFSMLQGKRVGKIAGTMIERNFDTYMLSGKATLVEVSTFEALFDTLARGRLDYVGGHEAMSLQIISQLKTPENVKALYPPMGYEGRYLAIAKRGNLAKNPDSAAFRCLVS